MLTVSQLFVYPIKSMGGIKTSSVAVTDRGLKYDRRWILVDSANQFLTQREFPKMALLKVQIEQEGLRVVLSTDLGKQVFIPFIPLGKELEKVTIWNAVCDALNVTKQIDAWFSDILGIACKLMYMPEETMRPVDTTSGYKPTGKFTSFADAYPFLLLGESSVADLNSRLETPVLINRFRPNIVFTGGTPYQEDTIENFIINGVNFTGLENCGRCAIVTIDQVTAAKGKEPLKTLATYRKRDNQIYFGQNVVHTGTGIINVGDEIQLVKNQ
jgi:uncharacterized protein